MDDQHSEVLAPPGRLRVDHDGARPAEPGGVVSKSTRRSRLRPLLWLLLVAAIVAGGIRYFPWPDTQPKNSGRPPAGAPVPVGVATVEKGNMPVTLSQLRSDRRRRDPVFSLARYSAEK